MASIERNRETWSGEYDWGQGGDEWSDSWGGVESHWYSTILPRIHPYLPAATILEIAPGFGRWAQHLVPQCERYIGVDLSEECVEACTKRFADEPKATFHVNDGASLPMVEDSSVDFVFTYDSLVHAEQSTVDAYVIELKRVLAPGGVAWVHQSNMAANMRALVWGRRLAGKVGDREWLVKRLTGAGVVGWDHWRAETGSAAATRDAVQRVGLICLGQELHNWGGTRLIDCVSVIAQPRDGERPSSSAPVIRENPHYMDVAESARISTPVYRTL